jgi:glycosyltransferase involved in cell wall biosynthesis
LNEKTLLVFQTAYPYSVMVSQDLTGFFTSKDLGGYFTKVFTINGFGDITKSSETNFAVKVIKHNKIHTYIESTNSKFLFMLKLPAINFVVSQIYMFKAVSRILADNQIDVIRAEDPRYNGILGCYFSWRIRKPLVVGCWGNPDTIRKLTGKPMAPRLFKKIWIEKWIEKFVFRKTSLAIAQNIDNLNYIKQFRVPNLKLAIFRLGNAINPIHFVEPVLRELVTFRNEYGIAPTAKVVICVSALEKRKVIEDAIHAFHVIAASTESHLILVGSGSMQGSYYKLVGSLGLSNSVTFTGTINQLKLSSLLAQADVILSPLTGRALAEGMLASTPVVAYDIDCHPDFINSGINGYLVEYRDVEAMARKAIKLLNDESLSERLGIEGRASILAVMEPTKLIQDQRKIFDELLQTL